MQRPPDPWDNHTWCRDEACPRDDLHPAHTVVASKRGRAPKSCPKCMHPIARGRGAKCYQCGWTRTRPEPSTAALPDGRFVNCPSCDGTGLLPKKDCKCAACSGTGVVPRTRARKLNDDDRCCL